MKSPVQTGLALVLSATMSLAAPAITTAQNADYFPSASRIVQIFTGDPPAPEQWEVTFGKNLKKNAKELTRKK